MFDDSATIFAIKSVSFRPTAAHCSSPEAKDCLIFKSMLSRCGSCEFCKSLTRTKTFQSNGAEPNLFKRPSVFPIKALFCSWLDVPSERRLFTRLSQMSFTLLSLAKSCSTSRPLLRTVLSSDLRQSDTSRSATNSTEETSVRVILY